MPTPKRLRLYILLFMAFLLTALAVLGPVLAPYDPNEIVLHKRYHSPNSENLLGTDQLGRDYLSRLLFAARNSFALTLAMVLVVSSIGTLIGMASGYIGGAVDKVAMQVTDILLSFPAVVFAIAVVGIWGTGIYRTLAALAIVSWAKYARLARGLVVDIRHREYLTQARFGGARWYQILFKYIMPNVLPHVVVTTTADVSEMMITLSALSFLGLVSKPPTAEWGSMLANSRDLIFTRPHMAFYPSLAIFFTVVVFSLLGDSLRDSLDPKTDS